MKKNPNAERAVTLALTAKRNILAALGARVEQPAVYGLAKRAALIVLDEGGTETDAVLAASMSFFHSVRQTCDPRVTEETADATAQVLLPAEGDAMNFFTVLADQVNLPPKIGLLIFALIEATGGDWMRRVTDEQIVEIALKYADVMGVPDLKMTLRGAFRMDVRDGDGRGAKGGDGH